MIITRFKSYSVSATERGLNANYLTWAPRVGVQGLIVAVRLAGRERDGATRCSGLVCQKLEIGNARWKSPSGQELDN